MKKLFSLFLAIMILLSAIGCASYKTKPHVSGTVLEVNEKDILIDLSEDTEGYPYGRRHCGGILQRRNSGILSYAD